MEDHRRPRRSLQLDQLERPSHNPILENSLYSPYAAQISRRGRRSLDATIHTTNPHQQQQQQQQQQQEHLGRPIYVPCRESSVHAHPDAEASQHSSESGDEVCSGQSLATTTKITMKSNFGVASATATATTGLQRPQTAAGIMNDPFPPEAAYFPARDRGAAEYMNVDEPARFGAAVNAPANFGAASPWNFGAAAPAAARADTKAFAPPVPPAANRRVRANSATLPAAFGGEQGAAEWVDWSNVDCAFRPDGLMQARAAMIEQCRQNSRRAAMGASVPMMAD
ncbi:unnamed protein product [Closterium sp. Yama58-4]|nr:unnamed protein product [Closterium sp. Yama58-4]